ncbi:MAG: hypothetical protein AB9Q22_14070 [Candidatus Reddybacter sp.]
MTNTKHKPFTHWCLQQFGDIAPFTNIAEAEGHHIKALLTLFLWVTG